MLHVFFLLVLGLLPARASLCGFAPSLAFWAYVAIERHPDFLWASIEAEKERPLPLNQSLYDPLLSPFRVAFYGKDSEPHVAVPLFYEFEQDLGGLRHILRIKASVLVGGERRNLTLIFTKFGLDAWEPNSFVEEDPSQIWWPRRYFFESGRTFETFSLRFTLAPRADCAQTLAGRDSVSTPAAAPARAPAPLPTQAAVAVPTVASPTRAVISRRAQRMRRIWPHTYGLPPVPFEQD